MSLNFPMTHGEFKKMQCRMSISCYPPCHMSLSSTSHMSDLRKCYIAVSILGSPYNNIMYGSSGNTEGTQKGTTSIFSNTNLKTNFVIGREA